MKIFHRRVGLLVAVAIATIALLLTSTEHQTVTAGSGSSAPSALTAITPCRLADTRLEPSLWIDPTLIRVAVSGRCGVPQGATAAAITVTITRPIGVGYVTAYPTGTDMPLASTINFAQAETRANGALIRLETNGSIDAYTSMRTDIIIDVTGYFTPAPSSGIAAGRYVALTPTRAVDTRILGTKMSAGSSLRVPLPEFVPLDAVALALNVTTTQTSAEGYFTAYIPDQPLPNASILNSDGPGQTRAAGFVGPVNAAGISIFSSSGGHLIVDIAGYFTGPSSIASPEGLFVPIDPTRLLDTRENAHVISAGGSIELHPSTLTNGPVAALVANWTLTEGSAGFLSAHPSGFARAETSTVNTDKNQQTVANLGITPVGALGASAFASAPTHLVVDVYGWFTGPSFTPGVVIAAVGDMVCPPGAPVTVKTCRQRSVSDLVVADPSISAFLALGDEQYQDGELTNFQSEYQPTYGRFLDMTYPVPGNHEYNTPGAEGYFGYFGPRAGDPTRGFYSFDLGSSWHIVALNSNCFAVSCAAESTQEQWLQVDLAANTKPCVLAFWHHPIFTSADGEPSSGSRLPLWQALQSHGADVVLNGHQHVYERFSRQLSSGVASPAGPREFVVGTGGTAVAPFEEAKPNSEVRIPKTFGILKLKLVEKQFSWSFVDEASAVLDSGTDTCTP